MRRAGPHAQGALQEAVERISSYLPVGDHLDVGARGGESELAGPGLAVYVAQHDDLARVMKAAVLRASSADKLAAKFLTQVPVWPARKYMMNGRPTHTQTGADRYPLARAPGDLWADARIDGRAGWPCRIGRAAHVDS